MVHQIKNVLLKHYLTGGLVACTEFKNGADVFSVNKRHYSTEVEIKTTRADLQREFRAINRVLNNDYESTPWCNGIIYREAKADKHHGYINRETKTTNYYLFCVVEEIEQLCAEFIEKHKLPYGLLVAKKMNTNYSYTGKQLYFLSQIISPKRLNKEKCPQHIIEAVARRACWEAYTLRVENPGK